MAHTPQSELKQLIDTANMQVTVGGIYHHYSSPSEHYKVLNIALLEETQEPAVIYQGLYGQKIIWIRTVENFLAAVSLPSGEQVQRFTIVDSNSQ